MRYKDCARILGTPGPPAIGLADSRQRMTLYHATTEKMASRYQQSGKILKPVRGFTTLQAAMAWSMKVGRKVIYKFEATSPHKLPDHHNEFGEAWWEDADVTAFTCVFSASKA